jgi:4-hydroxy-4-methyl-2-oxoglutarate aldolase
MQTDLALVEQLLEFETPLITEAMVLMGCTDSEKLYFGQELQLQTKLSNPVCGIALILEVDTSTPGHVFKLDDYWESLQMIKDSPVPIMMVMKCVGARPQHECALGDGMAKTLVASGSAGLVTDGAVRDIGQIERAGYSVFSFGTISNHCSMIYRFAKEPVTLAGVTIKNGDLIHGDSDGLTTIPQEFHHGIVNACIATRDFETKVHTFWRRSDQSIEAKREFAIKMAAERDENYESMME